MYKKLSENCRLQAELKKSLHYEMLRSRKLILKMPISIYIFSSFSFKKFMFFAATNTRMILKKRTIFKTPVIRVICGLQSSPIPEMPFY